MSLSCLLASGENGLPSLAPHPCLSYAHEELGTRLPIKSVSKCRSGESGALRMSATWPGMVSRPQLDLYKAIKAVEGCGVYCSPVFQAAKRAKPEGPLSAETGALLWHLQCLQFLSQSCDKSPLWWLKPHSM